MLPYDAIHAMALKHEMNVHQVEQDANRSRKSSPRKRSMSERLSEVYSTALSLLA